MASTQLQTVTLGLNGPQVPPLCIGTWAWGDKLFWSYGNGYGAAEVRQAYEAAIGAGIAFFDTAEVYGFGVSESLLGEFMRETGQPVQIATKFGPTPWRFSAQSVSDAITASLKRLQVSSIALYQVHWPVSFLMSQKTLMNALADEVKRGRIKAIGVSNYSAQQMQVAHQLLASRGVPLAANQVRYSLINRNIESNGILDTARTLGITILAYSPLAQGLLTGKYSASQAKLPTGLRQLDSRFGREGLAKIAPVINLLSQIADLHGRTPAQAALNWLIAQGGVIPIPGAKTAQQVKQNAGALGWKLSAEEITQLDKMSRAFK